MEGEDEKTLILKSLGIAVLTLYSQTHKNTPEGLTVISKVIQKNYKNIHLSKYTECIPSSMLCTISYHTFISP